MKTVILDRDGVINKNPPNNGYVCSWKDFTFLSNSQKAIKKLTDYGYDIFIATNQAGIGRGLFSEQQLAEIHRQMLIEIEKTGGKIKKIYFCPHHPKENCVCRKPKPGMLMRASQEYKFNISETIFIGDSISDIQAAHCAGASPILVLTGHGYNSYQHYMNPNLTDKSHKPDRIFTNLYTMSHWIVNR